MNNTLPASGFVTIAEVAEFSGLSEKTIRDHVSRGWLRAQQIGGPRGRIRVSVSAVYEWLGHSPVRNSEKLEDTDWSQPREGSNPNDLTICDEFTNFIPVAQSRLGEFFAKKQELGQ
jgi:excisionase family DNA binding protein